MISVAMCTYNGAKFLSEQLRSIADQTLAVDELVVCDDRSNDNSIHILKTFAATSPFPVHIHINEQNLGSTKNFEKCLTLCKGDVIFLCDQDDLWREDKVQKQIDYLNEHPQTDAVFSDGLLIDDNSKPTGITIWQEIEFNQPGQNKWKSGKPHEILFNGFVVTGATLAIRKSCLERLIPFPTHVPDLIHDAWIAVVLSLENKIDFIADTLIMYRIHSSQQVGFGSRLEKVQLKDRLLRDREEKLVPLKEKANKLNELYLLLRSVPFIPREKLIKLYLSQKHFNRRASLPKTRYKRLTPILNQLVRGYYKFSSKDWWLPAIGDLLE
ncbi:glycosyltransferase family 2 protein [Dyadobacter sediminis]|uniref:Glycosyltransferase family 2 protein n=1 Tax=Dyadobacter sediminis TaxID=1493691 RepID=A0A5R9K633_9BACT|nr:glycosyltransferase family 2 protein [Dyadobacter sediminis]TLU89123.1 glycosyltransferase family 2 protein [Dyadobacter sediminis]GGC02631.1 glycosyl transferase [Dyadobacter sediminis]